MEGHDGGRTPHVARISALAGIVLAVVSACSGGGATPQPPPRTSLPPAQEQGRLNSELIRAAWANDVDRAQSLIEAGADVNAKDDTVQSAFLIATSEGFVELLELTLRHGADVDDRDSFNGTGLIRAAERGHWQVIGRLIRAGTPLDHVNELGWTALHEAIILGQGGQRHLDTVRLLVAAGADVTLASQRDGVTPVRHASIKGYEKMADLLGAAARTAPRSDGARADEALRAAAASGDADAAALALRAGARPAVRDTRGRTPLDVATGLGHEEVVRLLAALAPRAAGLHSAARTDGPSAVTRATRWS